MQKRRAEGRVLQAKEMLARRDGQRGSHSCCNMTSEVRRLRRRHRLILDATAAQSYTYLGRARWRPKLFLATAFLMLGYDDTWFYDYSGTA